MLYKNIIAWIEGRESLLPITIRFLKKRFTRLTSKELMFIRTLNIKEQ